MRALIVETGAARGTLAAARALRKAGWVVGVGTPTGSGIASSSRAVSHRHRVPPPEASLEAFVETVDAVVREGDYEIVFGGGDAEVLALSAGRAEIGAVVPHASHDRVVRAHDKLELAKAAASVGVPTPRTVEATESELDGWQPPYLVKASLHAPLVDHGGPARLNALLVDRREVAVRRAAEIRAAGSVPFLQERVAGSLLACVAVSRPDGVVVANVVQVAEVTWGDVGVSVRARTVAPDPDLLDGVGRLLAELGWFGLVQLQFLAPSEGPPRLIDLNGRFYGSLALASAAGPNLPAIWAALATGRPAPPATESTPGIRYQWLEGDLRRAWRERRGGGLVRDVYGSLRYAPGASHSVWSWRDPKPFAHRLGTLASGGVRKLRRTS